MSKFDINAIPLKLQSPHVTPGDTLHSYILGQIEKLGKIFSRISKCEMMLRMDNTRKHICETDVKIFVPGHILYATGKAADFRLSTTEAFHDLHEQLTKYKDLLHKERNGKEDDVAMPPGE